MTFGNIVFTIFYSPVRWVLFKLPYSMTGARILGWFIENDPAEYSGS